MKQHKISYINRHKAYAHNNCKRIYTISQTKLRKTELVDIDILT